MAEPPTDNEPISSPQADYDLLGTLTHEAPCPYLPPARSRSEAYCVEQLDGSTYEALLTKGFRRSGRIVYRPRCRGCRECRQLRIPVDRFTLTRSMRRVWRINADVRAELGEPVATEEKFLLYRRYLESQHDDTMPRTRDSFVEFLYDSPTDTREVSYFLGGRLVGVGVVDRVPRGLSSVYMYFDPDYGARSLGTFSVLWEIDCCRREGRPYYYLGYYVAGSRTMAYKARFRPNEILAGPDRWISFQE